jgi:hypothetical protein
MTEEKWLWKGDEKLTIEHEFGTCGNISWLDPSDVKLVDNEGNEEIIPKCDKCGVHKTMIMGTEWFAWICQMCGGQ